MGVVESFDEFVVLGDAEARTRRLPRAEQLIRGAVLAAVAMIQVAWIAGLLLAAWRLHVLA
jgi:hypothetical protein